MSGGWRALERAKHGETAEALAERLGIPYVLEYDLGYFRRLRRREIAAAAAELAPAAERGEPLALARRGRVRRLAGDAAGARVDLERALRLRPGLSEAKAWLAELDLRAAGARRILVEAAAARPADAATASWLAVARLLAGRPEDAANGLAAFCPTSRSGLPWLLLGIAREREGRPGRARRAYARAAALEPSCSAAHWLLSRLQRGSAALRAARGALDAQPGYAFLAQFMAHEEGDWAAAAARLRRFAFAEPEKACWYDRQDDLLYSPFHEDEYRDARMLLRKFPRAAWAIAMTGRAALRCPPGSPRRAQGERLLARAARAGARHGWLTAWNGLAKLSQGDERGALADFTRGLARQPWYHRAYAWRGALLARMGRLAEASADLDSSIAIDEGYVFAYHQRSLVRRAAGEWSGAAADLERAFEFDSRYDWAFSSGRDPRAEDFARARRELSRALRARPNDSGLRAWRGQLRLREDDISGALADLERAAALNPANALAQAWLGKALLAAGRPVRATQALARAHELRPNVEAYRLWLAEAEHASGARARAQARLALIPPGRRGFEALATRARLRLEDGDARGALRDVDGCLRARGRSSEAYHLRALALRALGRWDDALKAADLALYASPRLAQARLVRAEALLQLGRAGEAVAEYGEISRRHPFLLNEEQRKRWHDLLAA